MPRVHIGLATLDRGPLFGRAFRSILDQQFHDFTLLVSDNASATDDTRVVVEAANDPRVRYHRHASRLSMGDNWNFALAAADTTYVALFHDDDAYRPQMLGTLVARLDADPTLAFAHAGTRHHDEEGHDLGACDFGWPARVTGEEFRRGCALKPERSRVEAMTVVMRTEALRAAGGFRTDWMQCNDADMWRRLTFHGAVAYEPGPLVDVRIRLTQNQPAGTRGRQLLEKAATAADFRAGLPPAVALLAQARFERHLAEEFVSTARRTSPAEARVMLDAVRPFVSPATAAMLSAAFSARLGPAVVLAADRLGALRRRVLRPAWWPRAARRP